MQDFILNGQASGAVASRLMASNYDPMAMRPWIGKDNREYVTANLGGEMRAIPTGNFATDPALMKLMGE